MGVFNKFFRYISKPLLNLPVSNNTKGKIGEVKVNARLSLFLPEGTNHRLIKDYIIVDKNGKSHQIDFIDIRSNGIFCIEVKNFSGLIFGSENQERWTQVLNNKKYYFLNPLKQNKSHIFHLSNLIGKGVSINSLIVMANNNASSITCSNVVNNKDLRNYLNNFNNGVNLTENEIEFYYNKIMAYSANMSNLEHLQNIRQTQIELNNGICPRCGGKLVKREGKYGPFYGCSNYPNCKFILNRK